MQVFARPKNCRNSSQERLASFFALIVIAKLTVGFTPMNHGKIPTEEIPPPPLFKGENYVSSGGILFISTTQIGLL